jgi:hypothetical protein
MKIPKEIKLLEEEARIEKIAQKGQKKEESRSLLLKP